MTVANKTDRRKLVETQVVLSKVVWFDATTKTEFCRADVAEMSEAMQMQLAQYGLKQIVADVVAGVDGGDAKMAGMARAVEQAKMNQWPRRAPAEGSLERAIGLLMMAQGCGRDAARALLGLAAEGDASGVNDLTVESSFAETVAPKAKRVKVVA